MSFERPYDAIRCQVLFDMLDEAQRTGRPAALHEAIRRQLHPDLQKANILTDAQIKKGDMGWIRTEDLTGLVPGWTVVGFDQVLGMRRVGDPSKIHEIFDAITFKTGTPDMPAKTVGPAETSEAGVTAKTSEAGLTAKTSALSIMAMIPKTPPE